MIFQLVYVDTQMQLTMNPFDIDGFNRNNLILMNQFIDLNHREQVIHIFFIIALI